MGDVLTPRDPSRHLRACWWLLFATWIWGISFPFVKALMLVQSKLVPEAPTIFFAALASIARFGIAGLLIAAFTFKGLRHTTRRELAQGLGLGVFGGLGILFQMDGLAHTAASTSAFLTQFYCLLIPLWVALRHRTVPGMPVLASTVMVLFGIAILSDVRWEQFSTGRGEAETLLSAVFFAGQILWLERPVYAGNRVANFTVVMFLTIAVLVSPVALATAPSLGSIAAAYQSVEAICFIGVLTLFCTVVAYVLMNYWQPHVSATEAGLIYCVEPLFASLFAAVLPALLSRFAEISYPNETLTRNLLAGGGLITLANLLIQAEAARQRRRARLAE